MKDFDEYDVFFYKNGERVRDTSATVNSIAHPSIYHAAVHIKKMFYVMEYDKTADFFVMINKKTGAAFDFTFIDIENSVE
jgi:hypothetical protein